MIQDSHAPAVFQQQAELARNDLTNAPGAGAELRVAVITPYLRESAAWLRQCHESVMAQSHPCTHIFVGDGVDNPAVRAFGAAQCLLLPANIGDWGDTPRSVGAMFAAGCGFDAIAFLDADNWYAPDHIAGLVELQRRTGATILTSGRLFHHLETGAALAECVTSDGEQFCDTSALMVMRPAFPLMSIWATMPRQFHPIADRVIWWHLKQSGLPRAHRPQPTLSYRATHAGLYRDLKLPIPANAKNTLAFLDAVQAWESAGYPPLSVKWRYRLRAPR